MNLSNVLKFLFPAVVYIYLQSSSASPTFGPFAARVKEMSHCENVQTEDLIRFDGRSTKINQTSYFFTGNITMKIPVTTNVNLHIDVAKFGNGGWKINYVTLDIPDACNGLKTYLPKVHEVFMKSIGNMTCPVPPGVYEICDLPLAHSSPDRSIAPAFEYGLYRGDFMFVKDERNIGCHSIVAEAIPLRKKG